MVVAIFCFVRFLAADAVMCSASHLLLDQFRAHVCLSVCDKLQHCENGEKSLHLLWGVYRKSHWATQGPIYNLQLANLALYKYY